MTDKNTIIDDFDEKDQVEGESLLFWKPKEQEEIVGVVSEINEGNYSRRKIGLKTNDGEELIYIPELTALNSKLKDLEIDQKVKIVYLGEEKSNNSGRMYMKFNVFIKTE